MNFEPCNPPLMDPLYLTGVSLLSEQLKPIIFLQQDLKITLFPEDTKTFPVRPFPVRAEIIYSTQPMTSSSHRLAPLTRGNTSPVSFTRLTPFSSISGSPISPTSNIISHNITNTSPVLGKQHYTDSSSENTPLKPADTTSSLRDVTPQNTRKIPPAQLPATCQKKFSQVHSLKKKSPRSSSGSNSPYSSPNTSSDSTPDTSWARNGKNMERHGISESQVAILKMWFSSSTYLSKEDRGLVSRETGLPEKTVMYWFQNQRRRVKKEYIAKK